MLPPWATPTDKHRCHVFVVKHRRAPAAAQIGLPAKSCAALPPLCSNTHRTRSLQRSLPELASRSRCPVFKGTQARSARTSASGGVGQVTTLQAAAAAAAVAAVAAAAVACAGAVAAVAELRQQRGFR